MDSLVSASVFPWGYSSRRLTPGAAASFLVDHGHPRLILQLNPNQERQVELGLLDVPAMPWGLQDPDHPP